MPAPQRYLAGPQTVRDIHDSQHKPWVLVPFTQGSKAEWHRRPYPPRFSQKRPAGSEHRRQGQVEGQDTHKPPQQEGTALPRSKPVPVSQQQLRITASGEAQHPLPCHITLGEAGTILLPVDYQGLSRVWSSTHSAFFGFGFFFVLHSSLERSTKKKIKIVRYSGEGGLGRERSIHS